MEAVEPDIINQKPKSKKEGLFSHGFGIRIILQGILFGVLSLMAFRLGEKNTGELTGGQTLAFMVLATSQVIQSFNMRSEHSLFKTGAFGNSKLNSAALISLALVALVLFTPFSIAFGLIKLPAHLYWIGLGISLIPVVFMELSKAFGLTQHHE